MSPLRGAVAEMPDVGRILPGTNEETEDTEKRVCIFISREQGEERKKQGLEMFQTKLLPEKT